MPPTQTSNPPIEIHIHPPPGESLTAVLHAFLPHSLAALRRVQFRRRSPHRTLLASFPPSTPPIPTDRKSTPACQRQTGDARKATEALPPFVIAFVDRSRVPETECWIFTSFELPAERGAEGHGVMKSRDGDEKGRAHCPGDVRNNTLTREDNLKDFEELTKAYLGAVFDAISRLACPAHMKTDERRILRVGSLHSCLVPLLASTGWLEWCSVPWQKWIFASSGAPIPVPLSCRDVDGEKLPTGFDFGHVPPEALELVRQRSEIRRTVSTLAELAGVAVFTTATATDDGPDVEAADRGQIVAWGFLGVDGSVNALHVETPWRGLGLAKAVMRRLLRRADYGTWFEGEEDGYAGHADVHADNRASRAVCARSGARYGWDVHWVRINLGVVEEGMEGLGGGQRDDRSLDEIHVAS